MDRTQRKAMEAVAKHLRFNVPTKSAIIHGGKVEYFIGSKVVDCLMASKWTREPKNPDSDEPYFLNRTFAVDYCNKLIREKFFVHAERIDVKPKGDLSVAGTAGEGKTSTIRRRGDQGGSDSPQPKKQGEDGEKRRRKFRLDVHRLQMFLDTKEDIYFWTFDPPSYTTYLIGFAVVAGAIALTLQPLWPDSSRDALWYLSVVVFFVMGFLVLLIITRWIIYGIILVASAGKLKFWVLPNLDNEKSGFIESFKPIYSVEWVKDKKKSGKGSLKTKDTCTTKSGHSENGSSSSSAVLPMEQYPENNTCTSDTVY